MMNTSMALYVVRDLRRNRDKISNENKENLTREICIKELNKENNNKEHNKDKNIKDTNIRKYYQMPSWIISVNSNGLYF